MCVFGGGGGEVGGGRRGTLNFACYVDWDYFCFWGGGGGGGRILNFTIFGGSGKRWLFFLCGVLDICRYFFGVSFKTAFFISFSFFLFFWGVGGGGGGVGVWSIKILGISLGIWVL